MALDPPRWPLRSFGGTLSGSQSTIRTTAGLQGLPITAEGPEPLGMMSTTPGLRPSRRV